MYTAAMRISSRRDGEGVRERHEHGNRAHLVGDREPGGEHGERQQRDVGAHRRPIVSLVTGRPRMFEALGAVRESRIYLPTPQRVDGVTSPCG